MVGWLRSLRVPGNASRADRIGSEGWFDTIASQPVRMLARRRNLTASTSMRESERKD